MWDKLKQSLLLSIILISLSVFVAYGAYNMLRQAIELNHSVKNEQQKIRELTQKKIELQAYLVESETAEAIEREAKERLNLKLSGEEVLVVVPPKNAPLPEQLSLGKRIRQWWNKFLR